jgi:hypothetical protein
MANLLAQAIDCDDPDRAAKIIRDALGTRATTSSTAASRRIGQPTVSGAPVTSASGSRPRRVISPRDRSTPFPPPWSVDEAALPSSPNARGYSTAFSRVAAAVLSHRGRLSF